MIITAIDLYFIIISHLHAIIQVEIKKSFFQLYFNRNCHNIGLIIEE